jgi:hypothetical protein
VIHLRRLEEAPVAHGLVFDIGHVGRHAEDDAAQEALTVLLEVRAAPDLCAHGAARLALLL